MAERSENSAYREKIAVFSGIEPEQVDANALELHRNSYLEMSHSLEDIGNYVDFRLIFQDYRRYNERMNALMQLTEGLLDVEPVFASYGLYMPSYLAALSEQKEGGEGSESHVALLVGAMTTTTVNEFTQTIGSIFENPTSLIIDIEGRDTAEQSMGRAHFVFADALRQPFKPGSIDSVQTNILLEHLQSNADSRNEVQDFFHQSYISLREGGQIILVEKDADEETDDFTNEITTGLTQAGFQNIRVEPTYKFAKRKFIDDYFEGLDLPADATKIIKNMKVFIATK